MNFSPKSDLIIWLGTEGSNKKEAGGAASHVEEFVEEEDPLIRITRAMHVDSAIQFWLNKAIKGEPSPPICEFDYSCLFV